MKIRGVVLVMKCLECGQEMEEGYLTLRTSEIGSLYWSSEQLPGFWGVLTAGRKVWKERVTLMHKGFFSEVNQQIKGSRCANCRLVIFEY
jgi:hypothetical protein